MPRSYAGHRKDGNHATVAQHCRSAGMHVLDTAQYGAPVDLMVVHRGVTAWVEIKDPSKASKKKQANPIMLLTDDEFDVANGVMEKGGCYIIAFSIDDIIQGVDEWLSSNGLD